jgi:hypothetical protein
MSSRLIALAVASLLATAAQAAPAFNPRDLQGVWTNASLTSLERPANFKALTIPEAEAKLFEQRRAAMRATQDLPTDPNAPGPPVAADPGGYNAFWTDPGSTLGRLKGEVRTSWIFDPADGRVPYSPAGRKALAETLKMARETFSDPEARPLGERCIIGFGSTAGPPMLNVLYNNNYQIVQTPDHVTIVVEMNHDARIIRLGAKHLPRHIRPWMGDSIGWWEGDTLVVETTNFNPGENLRPYFGATIYISENAKVTERFTRVSPTQIHYAFQVEDPAILTQVWRAEMPLNASPGVVYEYACHEGNYSLPGILAGARRDEREGVKTAPVEVSE